MTLVPCSLARQKNCSRILVRTVHVLRLMFYVISKFRFTLTVITLTATLTLTLMATLTLTLIAILTLTPIATLTHVKVKV